MENTAMRILFDELDKLGEHYSEPFKEFHLGKEKQQIVDAYEKCQDDCFVNGQGDTWVDNKTTGSVYYTQTFTPN